MFLVLFINVRIKRIKKYSIDLICLSKITAYVYLCTEKSYYSLS